MHERIPAGAGEGSGVRGGRRKEPRGLHPGMNISLFGTLPESNGNDNNDRHCCIDISELIYEQLEMQCGLHDGVVVCAFASQ